MLSSLQKYDIIYISSLEGDFIVNDNLITDDTRRKMTDKDIELFVKHNPEAYRRFKKSRHKKKFMKIFSSTKVLLKTISQIILWICAVGGFALSLIQFFQNK